MVRFGRGFGRYKLYRPRVQREEAEQIAVVQWAKLNEQIEPRLKYLFAVPNGGARNIVVARKLKAQGVKRGLPDLCLPVKSVLGHGLFIEMKAGKNKLTGEQKEWIHFLETQGFRTAVCYSAEEAIRVIGVYLGFIWRWARTKDSLRRSED